MQKCTICDKEFEDEDESFIIVRRKCILHCEKDDWYVNKNGKKDWSKSSKEIKLFWKYVRNSIENKDKDEDYIRGASLDFSKTIFPKFEEQYIDGMEIDDGHHVHYEVEDWYDNFLNPNITQSQTPNSDLNVKLNFWDSIFLDDVSFDYYTFKESVSFDRVQFKGECSFRHTVFNRVTFNNVNFFKSVTFEQATVNLTSYKTGDFQDSTFHNELKFCHTTFGNDSSKKNFDIEFKGTKFAELHILKCNFHSGLSLTKDTKTRYLDIQSTNFPRLHITGDIKNIYIRGKNNEIGNLQIQHQNLENLMIWNYIVKSDFLLNHYLSQNDRELKLHNLNLGESTFKGKVKIQFYEITKTANFYNTKFKDLADFYRTKFNKVIFRKTDFEKVSVFSEAHFNKDLDFKYTKFLGKAIFRDMVIKGKLNLRDTIYNDDATFLDITSEQRKKNEETQEFYGEPKAIQVANRETARIIKNFYDNSNNIIEANKFYALEMKEMEKELSFQTNPVVFNNLCQHRVIPKIIS